jgi:dynein heavy chain
MFSFNMTIKIVASQYIFALSVSTERLIGKCPLSLAGEGGVDPAELDFFLRGNTSLAKAQSEKPIPWISEKGWKDLLLLAGLKADFGKIPSELVSDQANWKVWNDSEAPEAREFPSACNSLSLFQKMCVVKCFRADRCVFDDFDPNISLRTGTDSHYPLRVQSCIQQYVIDKMGEGFVQPPVLDYKSVLYWLNC